MAVARFKKICIDAVDPGVLGKFWAAVLELTWEPAANGEGGIYATTRQPVLWVCRVPEHKAVKHRVHLDVYASGTAELEALGASVVLAEGGDRRWTVLADPEGGEFCAFRREQPTGPRLHGLGVDSVDPPRQARWWVDLLGGEVVDHPQGYSTVSGVPGLDLTLDFAPVPEPKTVKNRIHWEVMVDDVQRLIAAGARMVWPRGGDLEWDVLADPEGNEFCAFSATPTGSAL